MSESAPSPTTPSSVLTPPPPVASPQTLPSPAVAAPPPSTSQPPPPPSPTQPPPVAQAPLPAEKSTPPPPTPTPTPPSTSNAPFTPPPATKKKKRSINGPRGQYRLPPGQIALPNTKQESLFGSTGGQFSYDELMGITNGFSRDNHIGEGGFGPVYKGTLPDGRQVAVKQLKIGSGQGEREFRAEVDIISRIHHRHLVSLVGYCIVEHHRLLVYEFVSNKTLEHHLHGEGLPVLDWAKRTRIAIGSARGLAYLHEDCHPRIIHRDIKSANILLDESFEAQAKFFTKFFFFFSFLFFTIISVADFGLAKLSNDAHTHVSTRVMGTFGYLAPEYASSGKLTDRSDVYSFGVVLLELITGRMPVDPSQPLGDESLVEWARPLLVHALDTGNYEELVDPKLENNFAKNDMLQMIEAAAACVRHSAPKRPRMVQVLRALDSGGGLPDLSNGVKFGQSTVYDSGKYSADIQMLQKIAFESSTFSIDYDHSTEHEHDEHQRLTQTQSSNGV
ncbi:hypothetical protein OPV22_008467 [Ensete ventricosum]|uniref:non-specific serine/threonine protein kinase n=1 Tax=Ensete ventricosum TaxID=4639 RepID=A0AAV8PWM7_ENSVE|nr:hypothetical protein OPV22_008467 [Ensete ventricosum]